MDNPNNLQVPDINTDNADDDESPGFLQKGSKKAHPLIETKENPYSGAGFIDPSNMKVNKQSEINRVYRFKQFDNPLDQFNNVNYSVSF